MRWLKGGFLQTIISYEISGHVIADTIQYTAVQKIKKETPSERLWLLL